MNQYAILPIFASLYSIAAIKIDPRNSLSANIVSPSIFVMDDESDINFNFMAFFWMDNTIKVIKHVSKRHNIDIKSTHMMPI